MRRIKVILAVVAAVTTMVVLAAPAMADVEFERGGDLTLDGSGGAILGPGDDVILFSGDPDDFDDGDGSIQYVITDDPDSFDSVSFA